MGKSIAQWAKQLINEDNVKIVIQLITDNNNHNAAYNGDWIVYSGVISISIVDGGSF
jgi:hypothetical protein